MIIHNYPQGSEQWEQVRKGRATASEFNRILTPAKLQFAAGAKTYAAEKVAELLGVESPQPPPNYWMERGNEMEPYARDDFRLMTKLDVIEVGFIVPTENARYGASVDGLVADDGILEIKCPSAETLILWHDEGVIPNEYKLQIQGGLFVTNRKVGHFIGWHPDIEPLILTMERDNDLLGKLAVGIAKFTELVDSMMAKVKKREDKRLMTSYEACEVEL